MDRMSDNISRRTAMNAFAEYVRRSNNSDFAPTPTWNDAVEIVEALPSADAVKAVRCRDCKSFSHGYCKFHDAKFVREDGYCYWGERKDGEQG